MATTNRCIPVTADDYHRLAARRLPRFLLDYVDGGAGREESLADNEADFRLYRLQQRVLRAVGDADTRVNSLEKMMNEVFGNRESEVVEIIDAEVRDQ